MGIHATRKSYSRALDRIIKHPGRSKYKTNREGYIGRHENMVLAMLRPKAELTQAQIEFPTGGTREQKARGHILKVVDLTGETPDAVMTRLGLTEDERARIPKFHMFWR